MDGAPGQAATAEFHIGKSVMIRLLGAVRNVAGWVPIRDVTRMMVRDFENRDEEFAVAHHEVAEPFQADAEKVKRQCGKYRLRQSEIDPHRAPGKIEFSLCHEIGPGQFVRQPCLGEFDLVPGVDERLVHVDAGIMTGVQISYQLHPAPKAAATDVEQPVMRHEPLRNQKVDLELANFVPQPADGFTVPASLHLRLQRCLVVVTADRHGLSPALPVPFLHADCVFRIEARRHVSTFALYRLESMYEGAKRDRINQRPNGLASPHPTLPRLRLRRPRPTSGRRPAQGSPQSRPMSPQRRDRKHCWPPVRSPTSSSTTMPDRHSGISATSPVSRSSTASSPTWWSRSRSPRRRSTRW